MHTPKCVKLLFPVDYFIFALFLENMTQLLTWAALVHSKTIKVNKRCLQIEKTRNMGYCPILLGQYPYFVFLKTSLNHQNC